MIAHFLHRGHSLRELLGLSPVERLFYLCAWEIEEESRAEVWKAVSSNGQ